MIVAGSKSDKRGFAGWRLKKVAVEIQRQPAGSQEPQKSEAGVL